MTVMSRSELCDTFLVVLTFALRMSLLYMLYTQFYMSFIALTLDQILNIVIMLRNGRFTGGGGHF